MEAHELIDRFIDAAAESTKRARLVLIVITVASVLGFSATWNSSSGGWLNSRLQVSDDVQRWWTYLTSDSEPNSLSVKESERFQQAKKYVAVRIPHHDLEDSIQVATDAAIFRDLRAHEVQTIRVPFFGVSFDVNDLGLIGGFGFAVVLMWLAFSIHTERHDTAVALQRATELGVLPYAFDLIRMRQVMTIPPTPGSDKPSPLRWVTKLLFTFPFLVQLRIFVFDAATWPAGESISPPATKFAVAGGGMFLMIVLVLTIWCIYLSFGVDADWERYAKNASGPLVAKTPNT